jgi:hypothetical protein
VTTEATVATTSDRCSPDCRCTACTCGDNFRCARRD